MSTIDNTRLYAIVDKQLYPVEGVECPFSRTVLAEDSVCVLDSGAPSPGLFIWVGSRAE